MKKILATTAASLLIAGSVSAGSPWNTQAGTLDEPRGQEAGQQAYDAGGTQVNSSRPVADEDASERGATSQGAPNAEFEE